MSDEPLLCVVHVACIIPQYYVYGSASANQWYVYQDSVSTCTVRVAAVEAAIPVVNRSSTTAVSALSGRVTALETASGSSYLVGLVSAQSTWLTLLNKTGTTQTAEADVPCSSSTGFTTRGAWVTNPCIAAITVTQAGSYVIMASVRAYLQSTDYWSDAHQRATSSHAARESVLMRWLLVSCVPLMAGGRRACSRVVLFSPVRWAAAHRLTPV
jgi:hypothetical protein